MASRNNRLETTIDLAEFYQAMLSDIAMDYPTSDQLEFKRDSKRIFQQSSSRGRAFFMLDLPAVEKALLASLSAGRLDLGSLPHTRGKHRDSAVPKLFSALWIRIFDDDGRLREDADAYALRHLRQLLLAAKKADVEYSKKSLYATTKEFYDDEHALPPTPEFWDDNGQIHRHLLGHLSDLDGSDVFARSQPRNYEEQRGKRLLDSIQRVADRVASELGFFDPKLIRGRHGPGAVSKLPKSKYKYDFGMWSPNLEGVFDYEDFATANITHVEHSVSSLQISFDEEGSRLIPVPKTYSGPRLIAAEPISHQWIQQGVASEVRKRVTQTVIGKCIDFFDQMPSQDAALEASRTGSRATVDLKSASDNLTCYVIQRVFRANSTLLSMMRACRTRFLENSVDLKQQSLLRLRKFATMGSALTFPIQSIVFATICLGVGAVKHPHRSLRTLAKEVRVFGDDIVVPKDWVPSLEEALSLLKLKLNRNKTFFSGYFRESCGMDAYKGVDVTPTRIRGLRKDELGSEELSSMVDVCNNFHLRGYWRTAAWMLKTVPQLRKIAVVGLTSELPGLVTFNKETRHEDLLCRDQRIQSSWSTIDNDRGTSITTPAHVGGELVPVPLRWNSRLQRYELRIRVLSTRKRSESCSTGSPGLLLEWFNSRVRSWSDDQLESEGRLIREHLARQRALSHLDRLWSSCGRLTCDAKPLHSSGRRALVSSAWIPVERLVG